MCVSVLEAWSYCVREAFLLCVCVCVCEVSDCVRVCLRSRLAVCMEVFDCV